jgi:glycopeptide antibiotics resistance protein
MDALEFFPLPLLVGLGTMLVVLIVLLGQKRSSSYLFCFSVFWLYLLLVASKTIFPIPLAAGIVTRTPISTILSQVNLVPFHFGDLFDSHPTVIFREIFGNILLTVPFGFGIPFLLRLKPKKLPSLAIGAGLSIETVQLSACLMAGLSYRSVDINDMLLNAVGALLGYMLFRGFTTLYGMIFIHMQGA